MKIASPLLACYFVAFLSTAHCGRICAPLTECAVFRRASHMRTWPCPRYEISHRRSPRLKAHLDDNAKSHACRSSSMRESIVIGTWIATLSGFLLYNNYVQPFPSIIRDIPVEIFGLTHAVTAMLFGGGIILTTAMEWMVVNSKKSDVLLFWFRNVPDLDSKIVLPALTALILSGVGLAVDHYGTLGNSPYHVVASISTLLVFALWWAATDLTTQGKATYAVEEWVNDNNRGAVPYILQLRKISNIISCAFVVALYSIMVLKPDFSHN